METIGSTFPLSERAQETKFVAALRRATEAAISDAGFSSTLFAEVRERRIARNDASFEIVVCERRDGVPQTRARALFLERAREFAKHGITPAHLGAGVIGADDVGARVLLGWIAGATSGGLIDVEEATTEREHVGIPPAEIGQRIRVLGVEQANARPGGRIA